MDPNKVDPALLEREKELIEVPLDPMAPIKRLPYWLRMPTLAWMCYAWWQDYTTPYVPGEPQKAIWFTLILFVVTLVLSELLRPKPNIEDARPAGLGDFQFPTATEARVQPLIWGRNKISGPNVVWYGDLFQEAIREKVKTGLWSSTTVTKGFRYNVGVQFGICRGPDAALTRIWNGDTQVWSGYLNTDGATADINLPNQYGGEDLGNGGLTSTVEFYTGSTTQAVSPYLALHQDAGAGTNRTPRYTGCCYLVARGLGTTAQGAYLGNSTSVKPWSFEVERYPAIFSGQSAGQHKIGQECNPMNVLYEILTNDEWGFGFPSGDLDLTSFKSASDTLISESNGFSMVLDRVISSSDLIKEIQRQIDGVVFLDHRTGLWTVKLARADYVIGSVPQLTDSNVKSVDDFTRGSWEDTTNTINVKYTKRETDGSGNVQYKDSFAPAQDMGNALISGGGTVSTMKANVGEVSFPGVKTSALANNLAWRELRGQSYPLARCKLTVNREFWDLTIGDVVAWTNTALGFTQLPMRITGIDYGKLTDNKIVIQVVQDVFEFAAATYGDPSDSLWDPPASTLADFDDQVVMEAPYKLVTGDPAFAGDPWVGKIFAAAGRTGSAVQFEITQRNAVGSPAGSFADAGTVISFMRIGALNADLAAGTALPTSTITIKPDASNQAQLQEAFSASPSTTDLGVDLVNMILVNNEFMFVTSASNNGANVDLNTVYRGVLDTVQGNHSADDEVYLVFVGSGVSDASIANTNQCDVKLVAEDAQGRFTGTTTTNNFTFNKRTERPYPPGYAVYNGSSLVRTNAFNTPDLEDNGSGENGQQFAVDWSRREYDNTNEITALYNDNFFGIDPSTEYQVRVFVDPSGSNTEIASSPFAWQTGSGTVQVPRNEILEHAEAGTEIRVQIQARHDSPKDATVLTSRYTMIHDVVPTTVNSGLFYLGGNLRASDISNAYSVATAGVHTVRIGAAYGSSDVQVRINGGSWTNIILAGGTSGATASLSISDTIEVRHTTNQTPDPQFVEIENPSATRVAYGTFSS